ncbi:hypothetical protein SCANM124S_06668 [Streptomyces canus]
MPYATCRSADDTASKAVRPRYSARASWARTLVSGPAVDIRITMLKATTSRLTWKFGRLKEPTGTPRGARAINIQSIMYIDIRRRVHEEVILSRTVIDLDDEALEEAAKELGTTTKRDTINTALREVTARYRRLRALEDARQLVTDGALDIDILLDKNQYRS